MTLMEPMRPVTPVGPDQLRPAQQPCPQCTCCTQELCERGRLDVAQCLGHTPNRFAPYVAGCPCSAETTRGTHAWRAVQIRTVKHATEHPLHESAELILRALAGGADAFADPAGQFRGLRARGYARQEEGARTITPLGRRYLAARDERRFTTPVQIEAVDSRKDTATVVVVGWSLTDGVTVLLRQLTYATGLAPEQLPGRFLEAKANCYAADADDLVLTRIQVSPDLPAEWLSGSAA
ncbi:hypothetical protein [Streptomyces sp. BSE6.1]|uniref:hypothetical protein n=1 Tax=Streptomyces sp. BSE6.1 TaxID=2605730 RepID=UPI001F187030|nr:hypothetical protein [Streptomyces sp. BSE6.1]